MLDRLAESRERQRAFVADAAHELRSPLASMQTQLEVAAHLGEGGTLPAELLVDLGRLSGLVEDLLLLARSDADAKAPARLTMIDGRQLMIDVAAGYSEAAVPVTVADGGPVMIMVDPDEMRRAVGNLVGNAVRYATSRVELQAAVDHLPGNRERAVLTVSDDGPGIAEADRERVFQRFTRLDGARSRDFGGSGLGLSIVRELVTRAGGAVELTSAEPVWHLCAEIRLPAARSSPHVAD